MGLTDRINRYLTRSVVPGGLNAYTFQWPYANFGGNSYPLGLNTTLPGSKEEAPDGSYGGFANGAYATNSVVFACLTVRSLLFSEARFQFQAFRAGRPAELFGGPELDILEHPWPGATTGDLLSEMLLHADLGGNSFVTRRAGRLIALRPDWCSLILGSNRDVDVDSRDIDAEVLGLAYYPGGKYSGEEPELLQRSEFAHFAPIKDPTSRYRGMSPLMPLVREFMADSAATSHKLTFFQNGATPNMVIKNNAPMLPDKFAEFVKAFKAAEPTGERVYKTLFLDSMTEASVVGANLRQMDFKLTQGAGETRIAAALGVPPVIVGLSEGLQAATYSNYSQARRRFADGTMIPLWRNVAGSLETLVPARKGSRLWFDTRDIAFLRDDAKDLAEIHQLESQQIRSLTDAGFKPDTVTAAVIAGDFSLLEHTGLYSVQLQPPKSAADLALEKAKAEALTNPPTVPVVPAAQSQNGGRDMSLALLALAARERPSPNITIHNPAPPDIRVESPLTIEDGAIRVNVEPAEVRVESPVTIAEGAVRVESPVTVEPTTLTIEDGAIRVESPVTVEPASVTIAEGAVRVESTVEPTEVTVNLPEPAKTRKVVKRDREGRISEVTEE